MKPIENIPDMLQASVTRHLLRGSFETVDGGVKFSPAKWLGEGASFGIKVTVEEGELMFNPYPDFCNPDDEVQDDWMMTLALWPGAYEAVVKAAHRNPEGAAY